MDKNTNTIKCVICGKPFYGFGNSPSPIKYTGRCCDDCNSSVVVPARYYLFFRRGAEK